MEQQENAYVKTETHHGITTIEFYHPQSNSLPGSLLQKIAHEIHFCGTHDETKVIILKSHGEKVFCSGASFDELISITNTEEGSKFFSGFANVINAMRKCPKFIIARVQGKCVGGGVGLAAAADYAIATTKADIKLSELAVGIGPFVVGPAVERKIGTSAFTGLAIDARSWRNTDWAKRKGLFAEVHETEEGMNESVMKLAETLAHSHPKAMQEMKKMFWAGTDHWDVLLKERAEISGRLILSDFSKNAIAKFKKQ
ncbi:MAG: enoyl-CoA hydratase/isomerase family protein [Bacteroidetes bacterium]|nr:enoyl-CoA hydratase/isomerase family protein [Bacteroidota bacterium]